MQWAEIRSNSEIIGVFIALFSFAKVWSVAGEKNISMRREWKEHEVKLHTAAPDVLAQRDAAAAAAAAAVVVAAAAWCRGRERSALRSPGRGVASRVSEWNSECFLETAVFSVVRISPRPFGDRSCRQRESLWHLGVLCKSGGGRRGGGGGGSGQGSGGQNSSTHYIDGGSEFARKKVLHMGKKYFNFCSTWHYWSFLPVPNWHSTAPLRRQRLSWGLGRRWSGERTVRK